VSISKIIKPILKSTIGNVVGDEDLPTPPIYNLDLANFNGTDNVVRKQSELVNNIKGSLGMVSFWLRPDNSNVNMTIYDSSGTNLDIRRRGSDDTVTFVAFNDTGDQLFFMRTLDPIGSTTELTHILATWDTSLEIYQLYVNDVSSISIGVVGESGDINYLSTTHAIGSESSLVNYFDGCLGDVYLNFAEKLDIDILANRRKFIDNSGNAIYLGSQGELPTGNRPIMFFQNNYDSFEFNYGYGGNFQVVGDLSECL